MPPLPPSASWKPTTTPSPFVFWKGSSYHGVPTHKALLATLLGLEEVLLDCRKASQTHTCLGPAASFTVSAEISTSISVRTACPLVWTLGVMAWRMLGGWLTSWSPPRNRTSSGSATRSKQMRTPGRSTKDAPRSAWPLPRCSAP